MVFGSLPAAALFAALTLQDRAWAVLSGAAVAALLALFLLFGLAWERDSPRAGLVQRVNIIAGWTWLGALCWHLLP